MRPIRSRSIAAHQYTAFHHCRFEMSTTCITCTTMHIAQMSTPSSKTLISPPLLPYYDFRRRNSAKIFGCFHPQSKFCVTCLDGFMPKRGLSLLPPRLGDWVRRAAPEWARFDAWEGTLEARPRDEWPESASGTVIDETGSGPPGTSAAR
jgi:hypothetical protein